MYDVNKCCAHRRYNLCYPGCLLVETCVRISVTFSCDIVCTRHACMWLRLLELLLYVVRAYLRTICCTHAVRHQKDQSKYQIVNHRSMGAYDAFGLPRVRVPRFLRARRWLTCILWILVTSSWFWYLIGAWDLASTRPSFAVERTCLCKIRLHACCYWYCCSSHSEDTAVVCDMSRFSVSRIRVLAYTRQILQ